MDFNFIPNIYGVMYALSFIIGYILIQKKKLFSSEELDSLFMYIFFGVILGGRFGYVLFYNFSYYLAQPIEILQVWKGGMSFHGGVIGVIIAMILFSHRKKISFLSLADTITGIIPIGLFFGRLGNYFNKELLGFPYTGILAVEKNGEYFFPSPLLEAFLEGIILFLILYYIQRKQAFDGQVASLFLIGYGVMRIFVEVFFRSPDSHIGYILPYVSLGTILSGIMVLAGGVAYLSLRRSFSRT